MFPLVDIPSEVRISGSNAIFVHRTYSLQLTITPMGLNQGNDRARAFFRWTCLRWQRNKLRDLTACKKCVRSATIPAGEFTVSEEQIVHGQWNR